MKRSFVARQERSSQIFRSIPITRNTGSCGWRFLLCLSPNHERQAGNTGKL
jgi:hypothetical protein